MSCALISDAQNIVMQNMAQKSHTQNRVYVYMTKYTILRPLILYWASHFGASVGRSREIAPSKSFDRTSKLGKYGRSREITGDCGRSREIADLPN